MIKVSKKSKFKGPWPFSLLIFLLNPKVRLRLKKLVVYVNLRHFIMMLSIAAVFIAMCFIAPSIVKEGYFEAVLKSVWYEILLVGFVLLLPFWKFEVNDYVVNSQAHGLRAINTYRFPIKTAKFGCHVTARESGLGLRCKVRKDHHWKCKQMSLRKRSCLRKNTAFVVACYFCPWLSFVIAKLMCFFGTRLLNPELLHLGKDFMIVAFAVIAFCHSVMFFEFGAWFYIHYIWELKTSFRELDRLFYVA